MDFFATAEAGQINICDTSRLSYPFSYCYIIFGTIREQVGVSTLTIIRTASGLLSLADITLINI